VSLVFLLILALAILTTQMFVIVAVLEVRDMTVVVRRIATREFFRGEIERKYPA
jgi:hypothetical protein